jgi:alpha-tubulin suppressor-like RCC1 family protein
MIVISPNPPAVTILGSPTVRVNEGAGAQTYQLSLSFAAPYNIDVHLNPYGNALMGVDYMLSSNIITIPAGQTTASFTFTPLDNGTTDIPRRLLLTADMVSGNYYGMLNKFTQKEIFLIDNDQTMTTVTALSRGVMNNHQCAIKSDGTTYCWGANSSGQLGLNTSGTNEATPLLVSNLSSQTLAVATGASHTCAIKTDGTLWCWGLGASGQLGIGSTSSKIIPYQVGIGTYKKIAAGSLHTCAIKSDDTLWCWGSNSAHQLGDGTSISIQTSPVQVSGSDFYTDVYAGALHTCGLTTAGELKCWGDNTYGQASGNGTTSTYIATPTAAVSSTLFTTAALGGNHTCAVVNTTGELKCWGKNASGQLGDGSATDKPTPVTVIASGISSIAAGSDHTCAILTSGNLQCWGYGAANQIGLGSASNYYSPTTVLGSVTAVSMGMYHTCALLMDGSMKCWGLNTYNQLGYGREDAVKNMTIMEAAVTSIAIAENHGCDLTTSGAVRCWGTNSFGQVGDGTSNTRTSPVMIIPSGVSQIAVGKYGSCAVFASGKLQCWGYNTNGRLGDGTTTNRLRPTDIIASGVTQVSMGIDSTCALMTDTSVQCWGGNGTAGKVGNGSTLNQLTPVQVIATGATQVTVGSSHACALVGTAMYCWGDNTYGQFGTVLGVSSTTPMNTLTSMNYISAGTNYMCGINSGDLFCWGQNASSQIGDGTATTRGVPTQVDLGVAYSQVYAGVYHTCGITMAGALKCWGSNGAYQFGPTASTTPIVVMANNVVKASAGTYGTCAVESVLNGAYCAGTNSTGLLGLGNLSTLGLPLDVYGL